MQYGLIMLLVFGMQVGLYVVLPAWALRRFKWENKEEWLFGSVLAGLATAALLGRVCNSSGIGVATSLLIWLVGWLIFGVSLIYCQSLKWRETREGSQLWNEYKQHNLWLIGILLLAGIVRMIHPLQTWALGQSDAYSHLGFLMDVLKSGKVGNPDYPPAYAWVMSFPAWLSHVHPYWTARYGGVFFGVGLTLGVYALVANWRGRVAGLAAAGFVAGCPLFFLLQKTGVGSFANQLGLVFVIAAFWAFATQRIGWLALILIALAVSVPMMLLHVLLLLGLWALAARRSIRSYFALFSLLLLIGLVMLFISTRIPASRGMVIASQLTGKYSLTSHMDAGWSGVFRILAADFFSFKRIGYGSWLLNTGAIFVTCIFGLALAVGVLRSSLPWRQIGLWGLLTSANVHLGWLQFTDYQREGWSYLLALACFGGLLFGTLWQYCSMRAWRVPLASVLVIICFLGIIFPPTHHILAGPSESDVVTYLLHLDPNVIVLARKTSAFPGGQGDIARTLHPRVTHSTAGLDAAKEPVHFLRDRPTLSPTLPRAMLMLQPRQMEVMKHFCEEAAEQVQRLENELSEYSVTVEHISEHLDVWILDAQ